MMLKAFLTILLILLPSATYAWGPLTHVYLGSEIFYFASLLPAGLYSLLKRYRKDFIYGNLMADTVLAKKYMPIKEHPHNWNIAMNLQSAAETDSDLAFALGYTSHLAADTVAHGDFTAGKKNIEHALLEAWVDSSVESKHWLSAMSITRSIQKRNDAFLESVTPGSVIFKHKTNRRIFKGVVALSGLGLNASFKSVFSSQRKKRHDSEISELLDESLHRMLDVMNNGYSSEVLGMDPIGTLKPSPFVQRLVG